MDKILSVCIPSYNMERYLSRNLDSFLDSEHADELELIVVNDGSTDKTLEIANKYKARYPESVIVVDKPNGHYGSCVNTALKIAGGKYFRIVDADDWVDTDALNTMMQTLHYVDAEVVYTKYCNYYENSGVTTINDDPACLSWGQPIDLNDLKFDRYVHMHQISYLTKFLRDIQYRQTEGVCYTDTEYVFKPLIQAKNIYCIDIPLYQYFIGRDDQSMSPVVLMKNFEHMLTVLQSILDHPIPPYTNANYRFLFERYVHTLFGMLVDCLYASKCKNKKWSLELRHICQLLEAKNMDISHYLSFAVRGCPWFNWWLKDTWLSRCKLRTFFYMINLSNRIR